MQSRAKGKVQSKNGEVNFVVISGPDLIVFEGKYWGQKQARQAESVAVNLHWQDLHGHSVLRQRRAMRTRYRDDFPSDAHLLLRSTKYHCKEGG